MAAQCRQCAAVHLELRNASPLAFSAEIWHFSAIAHGRCTPILVIYAFCFRVRSRCATGGETDGRKDTYSRNTTHYDGRTTWVPVRPTPLPQVHRAMLLVTLLQVMAGNLTRYVTGVITNSFMSQAVIFRSIWCSPIGLGYAPSPENFQSFYAEIMHFVHFWQLFVSQFQSIGGPRLPLNGPL